MTDLDTIKAMFNRAKIKFGEGEPDGIVPSYIRQEPSPHTLSVENGYRSFFTVLDFDEAGALTRVSAWE